ncbi:MAG TPA: 30S ribosome-binding factor RbfA [candidate division Zixibacteria bacterium]|nr:30S ribosome-binding factor RbfA [candidate division Zixibacteria bacterium]
MSKIRQQRTAEQIRMILSTLAIRDIRDPRLQGITITAVEIDRELQYADVYVNALGDDSRKEEVMAALDRASGYFRSELASRITLRTTPRLHFHWDPSIAHAEHIGQLLDNLDIPDEIEEAGDE